MIILIINKRVIYHIIYNNINSDSVTYTCEATRFQPFFWATITTIVAMSYLASGLLNSQVIFKQLQLIVIVVATKLAVLKV
jgi:choline-glycine betaine transporter